MAKRVPTANFTITLDLGPEVKPSELSAELTDPNGKSIPAKIEDSKNKGKYSIKFSFDYDGDYTIVIKGKGGAELVRQSINPHQITESQNPNKSGSGPSSSSSQPNRNQSSQPHNNNNNNNNNNSSGGGSGGSSGGGKPNAAVVSFEAPPSIKGAKASDFKAVVTGPRGKRTDGTITAESTPGNFEVRFALDDEGEYELLVTGPRGIEVIRQKFDPAHGGFSGTIDDPAGPQSAGPSKFVIQLQLPQGVKHTDLSATITDPKGRNVRATIEQDPKSNDGCVIKFEFQEQGDYHLVVKDKSGRVVVEQSLNPSQIQKK
eukprot:TRINITY_DN99_c4_g2_i1.p1 TRINITY_DN99_c4_g2~~TRINITY_DN99_c4_g2_i1.p1  ORF type:complete len:317 (-),score=103.34 TRINITY_DN99_c4_g2_i1:30-980(-)